MIKVAPSILSANFSKLGSEIANLKEFGADLIHIDIMDGHFVPNITLGPSVVKDIRTYSDLEFDVHLMVSDPIGYIEKFAQSGADFITVHAESTIHLDKVITQIKSIGKKAGVALNPSTPLCDIEYILNKVDLVLIMSVNPGFGGQDFIKNSFYKIQYLKQMIDRKNLNVEIEVDGGITTDNAKEIINSGADILVAGSAIFNAQDRSHAINQLKK